jgi:hypothetical protein
MADDNKEFSSIQPFQRELASHAFNYIWDSGQEVWRALQNTDYGDFTITTQNIAVDMRTGLAGITGSDGITIGLNGAFPITDNGGSLTIDDGGGSITVDGTVSVTEPVSIDDNGGSITVDGTVSANQAGDWQVQQDGEWSVGQSGDWRVEITGGSVNASITGQPIEISGAVTITGQPIGITGEVTISDQPVGVTGFVDATLVNPVSVAITGNLGQAVIQHSDITSNSITTASLIENYTMHSYQVIFQKPAGASDLDIGSGANVSIQVTLADDDFYQNIADYKVDKSGTLTLPDQYSVGYDNITGGFVYNDSWNFKYARVKVSNYTSGTLKVLEKHSP